MACVSKGIREDLTAAGHIVSSSIRLAVRPDSFTLAIAHLDNTRIVVVDYASASRRSAPSMSWASSPPCSRAPASPRSAVTVYEQNAEPKSTLYTNMLPLLNSSASSCWTSRARSPSYAALSGARRAAQAAVQPRALPVGFPPQCGTHNCCMGWGGDGPDRCT